MKSLLAALFALALVAGLPPTARAQTPQEPEVTTVEEVVVLARRSGAPMWTVNRGDSTLILVGAITGIPRDLSWRPDDLEAAAARAQQILTPQEGRASFSDVLRVIWRIRTIARMPRGQTT